MFNVRIEGVIALDRSGGLKLFTEPEGYATEKQAFVRFVSLGAALAGRYSCDRAVKSLF